MLARIKSLFRVPLPHTGKFVPPDHLTAFQMNSWHQTAPISLTDAKMEALVLFFARSLSRRWSLLGVGRSDDGTASYIILLEAETEANLLDIFRVLADSPASERLSRR
jgi:hypothetical protein